MLPTAIPICSPKLPLAETILPYLQRIDKNRWYSNFGPLVYEFLSRIAALFNVPGTQVVSGTNGTIMLELCLRAMEIESGTYCIMPAWTFTATPLAATAAGLVPFFVDVDRESQALEPEQLLEILPTITQSGKIGAIIVTAPFGHPVNVAAWDNFYEKTGIPVIIDAAAAFDSILQNPEMQVGNTPMMVSLHATKVFGVGEGALILSSNESLLLRIENLTQFGFPRDIRSSYFLGTNAKISEYVAAVGLAGLDDWPTTRADWLTISNNYLANLKETGIQCMLSSEWATSTCNVILPFQADNAIEHLKVSNIATRKWWSDGCHRMPAFQAMPRLLPLKNTEYLRQSVLGLPFYIEMEATDIEAIVSNLSQEELRDCRERAK